MSAKPSESPLWGRRILAVRSGALGDTLLCLPALAALREGMGGEGRLELLGRPPASELARGERFATRVHSSERALFRGFHDEAVDAAALLDFLRPFDVVVSWSRLPRLRSLVATVGTRVLEASPMPPRGVHASDHLLETLLPLGVRAGPIVPEIHVPGNARREALRFLDEHGIRPGEFVAIHPGSGSPRKNWPAERFRAVAEMARESGLDVVWIEGEADAEPVRRARNGTRAPVARRLELFVLAALLAESAVFLGNDSGVTHLAAATATPTVALFGPTDPDRWAPRGRSVSVVDWRRLPADVWGFARFRMDSR